MKPKVIAGTIDGRRYLIQITDEWCQVVDRTQRTLHVPCRIQSVFKFSEAEWSATTDVSVSQVLEGIRADPDLEELLEHPSLPEEVRQAAIRGPIP